MILGKKLKPKVFCIGTGKTGTTSVEKALRDFGYKMGNQEKGELLLEDYSKRNLNAIVKHCKTAEAFQEAPFCFKYTFIPLDIAFPNSKFILTVRDSDEQWYESLVSFHSKIYANNERIPTIDDLKNATYRYKGYTWEVRQKVYGIKEGDNPYNKKVFVDYYNSHYNTIIDYFKNRKNLLVINLSDKKAYLKLSKFLNKTPLYDEFPWENKTSSLKV